MQETFGIASFRSRQQVMKFEAALRRAGVRVQIITTPGRGRWLRPEHPL